MGATKRCNILVYNQLSCSIVFDNYATSIQQLYYNFITKTQPMILRRLEYYFVQARKAL